MCPGITPPNYGVRPLSGCSPESRARTSRPSSASPGSLYKWRRQALIDAGQRPGLKSYEADPLAAARRRVKELQAELRVVKAVSALFEEGTADSKGSLIAGSSPLGIPRVELHNGCTIHLKPASKN